jgi:hypothetical protein
MAVLMVAFISCQDDLPVKPAAPRPGTSIIDARHGGGNAHFYFLPPLVSAPSTEGVFDPTLEPTVRICEWTGSACAEELATYSMVGGSGAETVRLDATSELYLVNWHTDQFALDPAKAYRISVLVAGTELGHADVDVVSTGRELRNVQSGEYVGLVDGRTLPIKFRIEIGAVTVVGSAGATVLADSGKVVLEVPPGALTGTVGITVAAAPDARDVRAVTGTAHEFGPDGLVFASPATLTLAYDPGRLTSGTREESLRLFLQLPTGIVEVAGSVVDTAANVVRAPVSHFSTYIVGQGGSVSFATVAETGAWGLWGTGPADAFAVGWDGVIRHFDGVTWAESFVGSAELVDIWGTSSSNVVAIGFGTILRFDGTGWSAELADTTGPDLRAVWGSGPSDVYVVGEGTILHHDGVNWTPLPIANGTTVYSEVWGSGPGDVYITAGSGSVLHLSGSVWDTLDLGAFGVSRNGPVWGSSSSDVYIAGTTFEGTPCPLVHFDGAMWSCVTLPPDPSSTPWRVGVIWEGMWGSSGTDVYVVGWDFGSGLGRILHYNGVSWQYLTDSVTGPGPLLSVWGSSANDVYVGGQGELLRGSR